MDVDHPHNQSYWLVVKEDQNNVILSSNNFTIQHSQIPGQESRYIVDSIDHGLYIQRNETPDNLEDTIEHTEKGLEPLKEDNFWNRNQVKLLLTLCLDIRFKNSAGDKILWNEIASILETTPEECDKKYRNLRRIYIRLLKKKRLGKNVKWIHYSICEEVFKDIKTLSMLESWDESKIRKLLTLYLENINKFKSPDCSQRDIWKEIASQLNTTGYNCYHKFKNLKRTYSNWLERTRGTGKLIKWPYKNYFERIYSNYNPRVGPWDRNKTKQLIEAYSAIAHKFRNPKFQKKELWREISNVVGESPNKCDRKFRNLKQTYARLKMRSESGRSITKWCYYKDFKAIYENKNYNGNGGYSKLESKFREENYVKQLLTFYIENKEKFQDPLTKKKTLWRQIGSKLGLTAEECGKKFRNLKQTYIRLVEKRIATGKTNQWPYYTYFEQIYDETKLFNKECNHKCNQDNISITDLKQAVRDMHRKNDQEKFEKLVQVIEDSNVIQRERNKILQALLRRK